jgi:tyrosine-protein kinase Etk/Wzc
MSAVVNNGPFNNAAPDVDEDEIDLGDLIGVLIENRWLIIGITFAAILFGAFHAFTAVPVYQADGLLQVEEKKAGLGDLDMSALLGGADAPISAEIEIIRSRSVLGAVVDNLQLDIYAAPDLSLIGAALARRAPANERPTIKIDTLDVPDYLRGTAFQLVALGSDKYELLDDTGSSLLRGTVGETATKPMPGGEAITLFVSLLQADKDQAFTVVRESRIDSLESLQGRMSVSERGDWSGILEISVKSTRLPTYTCDKMSIESPPKLSKRLHFSISNFLAFGRTWKPPSLR